MLTKSEELFELLCSTRGITYRRIPEGKTKTPDYEVTLLPSVNILVEVKQLDENEEDLAIKDAFSRDEDTPGTECPAERVRHQIAEAYVQLKASHRTGLATGVVLCNNSGFHNYIDEWTVTRAIFGNYGYRIGMPAAGGPIVTSGAGFMGGRKLTRNTCRILSFVAVMKKQGSDAPILTAFHNPYATVRVEPSMLSCLASEQFIHPDPHKGNWVQWQHTRIEV